MNEMLRSVILGAVVIVAPLAGCRGEPSNDALANDRPVMDRAQLAPAPGATTTTSPNGQAPNAQPPNVQPPNVQLPSTQPTNVPLPGLRPTVLQPPQRNNPSVVPDGGAMVLPATPLAPTSNSPASAPR